jgi:tetratricopeptide (TPR) repeat protein
MIQHIFRLTVAVVLAGAAAAAGQSPSRVLVMPFENARHQAAVHWLGEAAAVLLAEELNARGIPAITRSQRARVFEQLHLPAAAPLSRATLIKVGQMAGASEVIVGSFRVDGTQLMVGAHTIRIDVGRVQPDVVETAPLTELFSVFRRLAARMSPEAPARPAPSAAARQPTLRAFELYIKGLVAESAAAQATFLESAIKEYPAFDAAKIALWEVRHEQGDHAAALAAARGVPAGSPLSRRGRFHAGISLLELRRLDEAFGAFKALIDEAPPGDSAVAPLFNNLGVVQLRRGATPEAGTSSYYLTKAADADGGDPDYLFNLGYAYVIERNYQGAVYWLREALRRNPADADAHFALAGALQASGSAVEAARERDLARHLSEGFQELERRAAEDRLPVPKGLERVRTNLAEGRGFRPDRMLGDSAQREQRELAAFHLDRGTRLAEREQDGEALVELRRAVYLSPYEAQAHLLIGRIHLRGGRPQEAADALKISIWSEDSVAAHLALAEAYLRMKNAAAARVEIQRALLLDPSNAEAKRMLAEIK